MKESSICLKTINDLLTDEQGQPTRFWIPRYQRGYRWTTLQVTQLLDDIWEFIKPTDPGRVPKPDDFYCLQPLVIMPRLNDRYEVVDGQQRLTTIFLILHFFNRRFAVEYQKVIYDIAFETRKGFAEFLANPNEELANTNVDFFHLYRAIEVIQTWFASKQSYINDFESALLNRTKVIWFQLAENDNPVDAFTRLNVGKIPLTNDELIRALFLKRPKGEECDPDSSQLKIAYEWDQLEKTLQAPSFWYFLNNQGGQDQNRIGFLFELIVKTDGLPEGVEHDAYGIFYAYSKKLKDEGVPPKDEWLRVKQTFMTLEEWYEDRKLYHIIGFLIQQGMEVEAIRALVGKITKSCFEQKLRAEIFAKVIGGVALNDLDKEDLSKKVAETLDDLVYRSNNQKIRSFLLLFNLATLLGDDRSNLRFQFDSFKEGAWDIEHIRSVASGRPIRPHHRVEWLKLCCGYLETQKKETELCAEIEEFIDPQQGDASDTTVFDSLYERVLDVFQESDEEGDEDVDNGIANLTLLDTGTNRSYKNAVFAVKRQRLLDLDQSGIFVPLCTRNIFLKCYSPQVDNVMLWSVKDRQAYRQVMIDTLVNFFGKNLEVLV